MLKVILNGCNGKMGRVLTKLIQESKDMEIIAGFDKTPEKYENPFPVYDDPHQCLEKADVVIDFSHHHAVPMVISYCIDSKTPIVVATTGLSEEDLSLIATASESIPVFQSANMSVGVNLVCDLVAKAGKTLGNSFDIEIVEKHHNKKVDSPSGTAYMIANAINEAFENDKEYIYGRHGKTDERKESHIGIHAIRGGTIVGEHTVFFAGPDEIIEIKHTALSKDIFGLGAIKAAKFLASQPPGFYNMNHLLK